MKQILDKSEVVGKTVARMVSSEERNGTMAIVFTDGSFALLYDWGCGIDVECEPLVTDFKLWGNGKFLVAVGLRTQLELDEYNLHQDKEKEAHRQAKIQQDAEYRELYPTLVDKGVLNLSAYSERQR